MTDQPTNERVGRYQLLEPIGTGPTGAVSRAKVFGVAGFERQFAVKRFMPEVTSTAPAAQALSAAARSYGGLEHPRIARMAEFGVSQGVTFTAVELVPGLDGLRLLNETRLANVTLATGGALALVSQAARAIGYAHGRGISHLGLAPTNVIITADGDVKITDFALLAATLPPNPLESPRLDQRICYLAPEQIAGESTSAATDVFALGVLAYELVSGQRAFKGDTPGAVASAIVAGPPAELSLPRPIVRVLQRCLARSPFERFPDARALADALDAALRVAPVPGSRKDIGALVKDITDRLAALNENQMSGMLSLNVGTGPVKRADSNDLLSQIERETSDEIPTAAMAPTSALLAGATQQDMPRPTMTVPGLAPPPIPIPPGIASMPQPPAGLVSPTATLPGTRVPTKSHVPKVPDIRPITQPGARVGAGPTAKRATPPPIPVVRGVSEPAPPIVAKPREERARNTTGPGFDDPTRPAQRAYTPEILAAATGERAPTTLDPKDLAIRPASAPAHEAPTGAMPPLLVDKLNDAAVRTTGEIGSAVERALSEHDSPDINIEPFELSKPHVPEFALDPEPRASAMIESPVSSDAQRIESSASSDAQRLDTPASRVSAAVQAQKSQPPGKIATPPAGYKLPPPPVEDLAPRKRSPLPFVLLGVLLLGAGGAVAAWQMGVFDQTEGGGTTPTRDAAIAKASPDAAAATPPDAAIAIATTDGAIKVAAVDGAVVAVAADAAKASDAAVAVAATDAGTTMVKTPGDGLQITSTPPGARVFIDGSDQGVTPAKLAGTSDHHTLALVMPGRDLYVANIDGHGSFDVQLKEVTPTNGEAGIKVIKCKDKDRYYVFVDGKPTGMTCPTERIGTGLGAHTVEVYDVATDSRKKWDINITDTRLSFRVRIEN